MNNYHPESWSQQARQMSNNEIVSINTGWSAIEDALNLFSTSYRHSLIRNRAAKHFGRKVRENKVHENWTELYKHYPSMRKEDVNA